ncbi:unnamed protein product, partial [Owenia fusiformis]
VSTYAFYSKEMTERNRERDPLLLSTTIDKTEEEAFVKSAPRSRRPGPISKRTIIVEPTIFLYFLASTPTVTLTEQFVYHMVGKEYHGDDDATHEETQCSAANESASEAELRATIQAQASRWMLYLNASILVPQFFMVLILGAYSDIGGRKCVILISIAGTCLHCISNVIIMYLDLGIEYLIIGCVLEGLSGGGSALTSASFAYIADITVLDDRSFRMTALNAVLGISGAAAQLGIGYWINIAGYLPPFWFVSGVHIVNIFYVILFVPELNQQKNKNGNFNPCRDIKNATSLYYKTDTSGRNWKLLVLLISFALVAMLANGRDDVLTLFMLNRPLCWNSIFIGYFTATWTLLMNLGGMVGVKLFDRCFTDGGMIMIASVLGTATQVIQAFARNIIMMFIGPVLGMFASMFLPLIRAIMSKTVMDDEQGALFAGIGCVETACVLGGSSFFNMIYAVTVHWFGGFVFLVMGGISLLSMVTFGIYMKMSGMHLLVFKQREKIRSTLSSDESKV